MSKQKLLVWDPAQKRWVPQRRTSGSGGSGGGYSEVIIGDTSLTSDGGDPLTIAADPPIQVTGDADTDTVTIGIRMGPGSNLDADLLDGLHAAAFALASHEHSLSVRLGVNSSSVTIGSTTQTIITSASLTSGKWILIGVLQAIASSSTEATLTGYLNNQSTTLRSLGVSATSSSGLATIVLMALHIVTDSDTITLGATTSSTSYTFTALGGGCYILAIRYAP